MARIISGDRELRRRIERITPQVKNEIELALIKSALFVERDAKIKVPIDTGRLRSSLTHTEDFESDNPAVEVGTNVEYAAAVEFGTSRQAAKPYLFPALNGNKSKILRELAKAFRKGAGL